MNYNLYKEINENISFARVESEFLMQPDQLNPQGTIHGGEIMKTMDTIAGIAARKHCKGKVVTRRLDDVEFFKPIEVGDVITIIAQLIYVGTSSMEILVQIYLHDLMDFSNPQLATSAFVTMIHLVDESPHKVPKLVVKSNEDKILYDLGEKKHKEIRQKINMSS